MNLDLGIAASGASSAESGGPFYDDASINFGSRYAGAMDQSNSPNTTSDATASERAPSGVGTGAQYVTSGSSSMLWIVLLVGGAAAVWFIMRKK